VTPTNYRAILALQARLADLRSRPHGDVICADKDEDKIRTLEAALRIRQLGQSMDWSDAAIEHAVETNGTSYGDECVIQMANGRNLRTPAYPAPCSYIRVEHEGHELGYWTSQQWEADAEVVRSGILSLAHGGAGTTSARFGFMYRPINNVNDARRFLAALFAHDLLFHLDDAPESILSVKNNNPVFTPAEAAHVRARRDEIFQLPNFDPHGFCIALIGE
jgi:hypothetical protein